MGREAVCTCDWAGEVTEVKALLETGELILRGGLRKRLPFSELKRVKAVADGLSFTVGGERVELLLGSAAAERWASIITSPPPSLAKKLGITPQTVTRVIGSVCDESLQGALNEASKSTKRNIDLLVACVDSSEKLSSILKQARAEMAAGVPIWIVYAKGKGHAVDESAIRSELRGKGFMDTKVVSVSAKFTALRFNLRKPD
jgi:hypothetical protein